ncbi:MAG: adenylate/guanylate cyclase domain-containing protein [Melioribacteraceae bacterium]|nr:adenylate/guanylate cyclase domain-containing protein [Melioribacteraceae bacterium]
MKFNLKLKILFSIIIAAGSVLIALFTTSSKITATFNNEIYDMKVNLSANTLKADTNIVIVAVDQTSLEFFENNAIGWPWPRLFYAEVLKFLKAANAGTVLFDVDFSSREIDRWEIDAKTSESAFAEAIRDYNNVILISSLSQDNNSETEIDKRFRIKENIKQYYSADYNDAVLPLESFRKNMSALGIVNVIKDPDGIIRRSPLIYKYKDFFLPHAALASYILSDTESNESYSELLGKFQTDSLSQFLINWYGPSGKESPFEYYSIHSLVVSASKLSKNIEPDIPLKKFEGKTVIIGGTAFALLDYKPVPIQGDEPYPGMEIHATLLSNLRSGHFITPFTSGNFILMIGLLSFITSFIFFIFSNRLSVVIFPILILLLYILTDFGLFYLYRIFIPSFEPVLAVVLSLITSSYISYIYEGKQRKQINQLFSRYINPHVVRELLDNPDEIELKGKEVEATIFFSDIEDFTTVSEKMNPQELLQFLNEYFGYTSSIILNNDALLDKYIGDAIMAVFGVPIHKNDHAASACQTALDMQKSLKKLSVKVHSSEKWNYETRIGINTGKIVVGNIGTSNRSDYTAIGDPVNVASRLESINKFFKTNIIISETTQSAVDSLFLVRELDMVRVKGKKNAMKIYELCSELESADDLRVKLVKDFSNALDLYRKWEWNEALQYFEEIYKTYNDYPALIYINRCRENINQPPDKDWDSVYNFSQK